MTCMYDDDFHGENGAAPNPGFWTESDTYNLLDIQSDKLNFSDTGSTSHSATITSKYWLRGDFDIQVDFDGVSISAVSTSASYACQLQIKSRALASLGYVARARSATTDGYAAGNPAGTWIGSYARADAAGKLRLVRTGSSIRAYMWNSTSSRWEWNGNTSGIEINGSYADPVSVNIYAKKQDGSTVTANWTAFTINAACPGYVFGVTHSQALSSYFDPQPSGLIDGVEEYASDTGQFTRYTENTQGTFNCNGYGNIVHNSGAARNDIIVRSNATFAAPNLFVSAEIPSCPQKSTGYDNPGVGIVKDAGNFVLCSVDRVALSIRLQVKIGGSNNWAVTVSGQLWLNSPPFKLGLSLNGNSACIWKDSGSGWQYMGGANIGGYYDFRTSGNLSGWRAGIAYATGNNGQINFDNLKWGRFGGVGMRDFHMVTNEDGSPYIGGTFVYFTATLPDPRQSSNCGVFRMNMETFAMEQIGTLFHSRDGKIYDDINGHIVRRTDGTFHLLMVSWANGMGNEIRIYYKNEGSLNLLSGLNVISGMTKLTLPGLDTAAYGCYDGMLYYNAGRSRWEMVYSITDDTDFSSTFWPAAAYSSDLSTWSAIAEDTSSYAAKYEGTIVCLYDSIYYLMAGGPSGSGGYGDVWDENLAWLGRLNLAFPGTAPSSHPMMFQYYNRLYVLTFDNTQFPGGTGIFTCGQPKLYYIELPSNPPPSEVRQDRIDISGNARHLSDDGALQTGNAQGKIGNAAYFSGAGEQLLRLAEAPDLTGDEEFTVAFRMKPHLESDPAADIYWYFKVGDLEIRAGFAPGQTQAFVSVTTPSLSCNTGSVIPADTFSFIAVYFDTAGLYIDLNDTNEATDAGSGTGIVTPATGIEVGINSAVEMNISIDELGMWVGANALSAAQRTTLYSGNYGQRPTFS